LPNAQITFDKFRVVRHANAVVDKTRHVEQRTDKSLFLIAGKMDFQAIMGRRCSAFEASPSSRSARWPGARRWNGQAPLARSSAHVRDVAPSGRHSDTEAPTARRLEAMTERHVDVAPEALQRAAQGLDAFGDCCTAKRRRHKGKRPRLDA
jgi:hypothetical protein